MKKKTKKKEGYSDEPPPGFGDMSEFDGFINSPEFKAMDEFWGDMLDPKYQLPPNIEEIASEEDKYRGKP